MVLVCGQRDLLRVAQAKGPLGVASSEGIEKCLPSWLPRDVLTLGSVYARGVPGSHHSPRLGPFGVSFHFGFLRAEPWIASYWGKKRSGVTRVFPVEARPSHGPGSLSKPSDCLCWLHPSPLDAPGRGQWASALAWVSGRDQGEGQGRERRPVSPGWRSLLSQPPVSSQTSVPNPRVQR